MKVGEKLTDSARLKHEPRPDVLGESTLAPASAVPPYLDVQVPEQAGTVPTLPVFGHALPLPASLRALGHRNFRLFWTGQLISLVGTWMQAIARGWLVLELTHSPFWLGMVGFANSVPVLVLSLWGGEIADRFDKRRLVVVTQAVSMVLAFVLATLTFTRTVQVWHILAISLILGGVFSFDMPARQAFTVEMVGKEDVMNAVALNSAIFNGARVAGPAVGAVVLAWWGPGMAFFLNGISYVAVIAGLLMMRMPKFTPRVQRGSTRTRIAEGVQYVRQHDTIAALMVLVSVVSVFAFPYTALMPVFADSVLKVGQGGYGTLMAFSGIGSLIGAVSLALQSSRATSRRGRSIVAGALAMPMFLGVFAMSRSYILSLAMLIGLGFTMISVNTTINTVLQTNVPDELRGRVLSVYSLLFNGVAPFGQLEAGLVASGFGAPFALLLGATVCAANALYILIKKRQITSIA